MFYSLFGAAIGFWKTPEGQAMKTRLSFADPDYPGLVTDIVPNSDLFTVALVGAVLDRVLLQLTDPRNKPHFAIANLYAKAPPYTTIGLVRTSPRVVFQSDNPNSIATVNRVAASPDVTVDVSYKGQPGGAYGNIPTALWLRSFYYVSRGVFQNWKSDKVIPLSKTALLVDIQFAGAGGVLSAQLWGIQYAASELKIDDMVTGFHEILKTVVADERFELVEAIIRKDGAPFGRVVFKSIPASGPSIANA